MSVWVKQSLSSHHKVQIYLTSLGDVTPDVDGEYRSIISKSCSIPFANLTEPSTFNKSKSAFKSCGWEKGRFNFHLTVGDGTDGGLSEWGDYQAYKRVFAAIGVVHFPSCPDLAEAEKEFQRKLRGYNHVIVKKIFVFGISFDEVSAPDLTSLEEPNDVVIFPPAGQCEGGMSMVEVHMGVVLGDMAVTIFEHLEKEATTLKDSLATGIAVLFKQEITLKLQSPFESEEEAADKSSRKKRGRARKWLGDLALLAGLPLDAAEFYTSSISDTKGWDALWCAGSQEGYAASLVSMKENGWDIPKEFLFKSDDDNGKSEEELLEAQVSRRCAEALHYFGLKGQRSTLEVELAFKLARFFMQHAAKEERVPWAMQYLRHAAEVPELGMQAQVARTLEVALCCRQLGLHRKAALFMSLVGARCAEDGNPHAALALTSIASASYGALIPTSEAAKEEQGKAKGWASLKKQLLELLIMHASASGNVVEAAAHYSSLLQIIAEAEMKRTDVLDIFDVAEADFDQNDQMYLDISHRGGFHDSQNIPPLGPSHFRKSSSGLGTAFLNEVRDTLTTSQHSAPRSNRRYNFPQRKDLLGGTGLGPSPTPHTVPHNIGAAEEDQSSIVRGMMLLTERLGKLPKVKLPGIPHVHSLIPLELDENSKPQSFHKTSQQALASSTFFYSPFDGPNREKSEVVNWIVGEMGRVRALFSNPLGIDIAIQGAEVISDNSQIISYPVAFTLGAHVLNHEVHISLKPQATGSIKLEKLKLCIFNIVTEYEINRNGSITKPPKVLVEPWSFPRKVPQEPRQTDEGSKVNEVQVLPQLPLLIRSDQGCSHEVCLHPGETKKMTFSFVNQSEVPAHFVEIWLEESLFRQKQTSYLLFSSLDDNSTQEDCSKSACLSTGFQEEIKQMLPIQRHQTLSIPVEIHPNPEAECLQFCLKYTSELSPETYRQYLIPLRFKFEDGLEIIGMDVFDVPETCDHATAHDHDRDLKVLVMVKVRNRKSPKAFNTKLSCILNGQDLITPKTPDEGQTDWVVIESGTIHCICGVMQKLSPQAILASVTEPTTLNDPCQQQREESPSKKNLTKEEFSSALINFISSSLTVRWQAKAFENARFGTLTVPSHLIPPKIAHRLIVPQLVMSWSVQSGDGTRSPESDEGSERRPFQIEGDKVTCHTFKPIQIVVEISNKGTWPASDVTLRLTEYPITDIFFQSGPPRIAWSGLLETTMNKIDSNETVEHTVGALFLEPGAYRLKIECSIPFSEDVSDEKKGKNSNCTYENDELNFSCRGVSFFVKDEASHSFSTD